MRDKLANFRPRNPPKHIIYYTIMGVSNLTISVDIAKRTVIRSTLPQPDLTEPYYRVDIPSDLVRELILHDMNWEELGTQLQASIDSQTKPLRPADGNIPYCRPQQYWKNLAGFLNPNNTQKIKL